MLPTKKELDSRLANVRRVFDVMHTHREMKQFPEVALRILYRILAKLYSDIREAGIYPILLIDLGQFVKDKVEGIRNYLTSVHSDVIYCAASQSIEASISEGRTIKEAFIENIEKLSQHEDVQFRVSFEKLDDSEANGTIKVIRDGEETVYKFEATKGRHMTVHSNRSHKLGEEDYDRLLVEIFTCFVESMGILSDEDLEHLILASCILFTAFSFIQKTAYERPFGWILMALDWVDKEYHDALHFIVMEFAWRLNRCKSSPALLLQINKHIPAIIRDAMPTPHIKVIEKCKVDVKEHCLAVTMAHEDQSELNLYLLPDHMFYTTSNGATKVQVIECCLHIYWIIWFLRRNSAKMTMVKQSNFAIYLFMCFHVVNYSFKSTGRDTSFIGRLLALLKRDLINFQLVNVLEAKWTECSDIFIRKLVQKDEGRSMSLNLSSQYERRTLRKVAAVSDLYRKATTSSWQFKYSREDHVELGQFTALLIALLKEIDDVNLSETIGDDLNALEKSIKSISSRVRAGRERHKKEMDQHKARMNQMEAELARNEERYQKKAEIRKRMAENRNKIEEILRNPNLTLDEITDQVKELRIQISNDDAEIRMLDEEAALPAASAMPHK